MAGDLNQPDSVTFTLGSMAALHRAVAMTRSLPFMKDVGVQEQTLICTVVSELGTNILKFAGTGTVSLARIVDGEHDAIQVIAHDDGPGIRDLDKAMQDGYSTAETLGLGLPAVRRIMSTMKVESTGKGTKVIATKWLDRPVPRRTGGSRQAAYSGQAGLMRIEHAQEVRPCRGETVSGDIALVHPRNAGLLFGIIDVSGHGPEAHRLAQRLGGAIAEETSVDLELLLKLLHRLASGTRGAAAGLAILDRAGRRLSYAGVGNVHIRVIGARPWRGVSRDGILGERMPTVFLQSVDVSTGDLIAIASDGVSESSRTTVLVRGSAQPASQIAREVILQAGKTTDDASCVVIKCL